MIKAGCSAARMVLGKRLQYTRRGRVAAPADLEPPTGMGFGLGRGQRSGWSRPTCKIEIDDKPPAQSFVPTSPVHSGSLWATTNIVQLLTCLPPSVAIERNKATVYCSSSPAFRIQRCPDGVKIENRAADSFLYCGIS